jgi:hypothetical protein
MDNQKSIPQEKSRGNKIRIEKSVTVISTNRLWQYGMAVARISKRDTGVERTICRTVLSCFFMPGRAWRFYMKALSHQYSAKS